MQAQFEKSSENLKPENNMSTPKDMSFLGSLKFFVNKLLGNQVKVQGPTEVEQQTRILIEQLPTALTMLHGFSREFHEGLSLISKDAASMTRLHLAVEHWLQEHGIEIIMKAFERNNSSGMGYLLHFLTYADRLPLIAPGAHELLQSIAQNKIEAVQMGILRFVKVQLRDGIQGHFFLSDGQARLLQYLSPNFTKVGMLTSDQGKELLSSIDRALLDPKVVVLLNAQVDFIESLVVDKQKFHEDLEIWKGEE